MNPERKKHDTPITFRLSREDKEKIERVASTQGLTVAEVIRHTIHDAMECPIA